MFNNGKCVSWTTVICSSEQWGFVTRELIGVLILAVLYKVKDKETLCGGHLYPSDDSI
jgi:hypothetical protein